jgi:hypothetical protein
VLWDIGGLLTELVNGTKMTKKSISIDNSMNPVYFIRYSLMPKQLWRSCIMEQSDNFFFYHGSTAPSGPKPPHYRGFMITLRHTTDGRTLLDERPARRRELYLTTHNTHNRQTSMTPARFEPTIPASGRRPTP